MQTHTKASSAQRGFTLVELAIVLVIIGLLITGLLKGAELISSARVKSTIQQVRALDAATTTFRDSYRFLPGDVPTPNTRLPNCTGANCQGTAAAANGNGRIDELAVDAAYPTFAAENPRYFVHLAVADLISGINIDGASTAQFGDGLLESSLGRSGFGIGYFNGGALASATTGATNATAGHYLSTRSAANVATGTTSQLRPLDVQQIDLKLDDGAPGTGTVRGAGGANCAAAVGLYNTVAANGVCDFYAKIQN